jgi:putative acetyltransferase
MIIRDECPEDAATVGRIISAAFGGEAEARLVERLRDSGDAVVALVAQDAGEIVGHILLSKMQAPFPALALAPLAVRPDRQGRGAGSALVRQAIARARNEGWAAIFVLGAPGYYGRFGFDAGLAEGFASSYAGEHFMALALSRPLAPLGGPLRHAPAFADLD